MVYTVPISSKGQITLPVQIRRKLGVAPGKDSLLLKDSPGGVIIKSLSRLDMLDLYGVLAVPGRKPVDIEALIGEAKRAMAEKIAREGMK